MDGKVKSVTKNQPDNTNYTQEELQMVRLPHIATTRAVGNRPRLLVIGSSANRPEELVQTTETKGQWLRQKNKTLKETPENKNHIKGTLREASGHSKAQTQIYGTVVTVSTHSTS